VIFFHLEFGFSHGFLGVDIFFVISGYVIATRAIWELRETGRFSLVSFFFRRVYRIFPALCVMLCISAVLSFFFQTPFQPVGQQQVTAKTGLSSLFFGANFVIPQISSGYFGTLAQSNAMTHLWSTSVEGQFYLFFSLIFLAISKKRFTFKFIGIFFSLVGIVSFVLYIAGESSDVFFKVETRAWEFILGILVALFVMRCSSTDLGKNKFIFSLISVLSFFLIVISQLSFLDLSANLVLFLCLGGTAFLLFLSGVFPEVNSRFLYENKALISIGNASYSIYLWHWPLIIFLGLKWGSSGISSLILLPITLICGFISHKFIEEKFKYTPIEMRSHSFQILALFCASAVFLTSLGFGSKQAWGLNIFGLTNPPLDPTINCVPFSRDPLACSIGPTTHRKSLVLVGDSQASSFAQPFFDYARKNQLNFTLMSQPGGPYIDARCTRDDLCVDSRTVLLNDLKPDYLIVANLWNSQESQLNAIGDMEGNSLSPMSRLSLLYGTRIVFISPIPMVSKFDTKFTLLNKFILKDWTFKPIEHEYQKMIRNQLLGAASLNSEFFVIDPYSKICRNGVCKLLHKNFSIYRDSTHVTPSGAKFVIGDLLLLSNRES
jgi:peptidoglycan/LPS O-acetylase OafA/YrhL